MKRWLFDGSLPCDLGLPLATIAPAAEPLGRPEGSSL